jgi:hypothetical protein
MAEPVLELVQDLAYDLVENFLEIFGNSFVLKNGYALQKLSC